jgi:methionyl-tRNA synthetase
MPETIFVGVAWPYVNGVAHQGHIAGVYLPADIFARYHRMRGNRVLMVSGSDQHGTPITVQAEREGRTPQDVVDENHPKFLDIWRRLGISFDLYTSTGTDTHRRVVHDMFLRLLDQGDIYLGTMDLPYCPVDTRFLLDRYVEGICPNCGYNKARGDQCESCQKLLDPIDLITPHCIFCGTEPEIRPSEHFFLRLSAFNAPLLDWITDDKEHWRPHVRNLTIGALREGVPDRAITRDIDWGVPIPVEGFESKRLYVWFEAVIGYLSASHEWAEHRGEPEAWRAWWEDPAAKAYYFLSQDNIIFHTVVWPAMLLGYGGLNLPYDVPATQWMNLSGRKASKSANWAVWMPDYLARYDPDPLRYYLAAAMPEVATSDFTWGEYLRRNNDELVATWGNLVNRTLTFVQRHFDGRIPEPGEPQPEDRDLITRAEAALQKVGEQIGACHFRAALATAMELAQETNRYLDRTAPWKTVNTDRAAAARSLYTVIAAIGALRTALYPYLPFTSERLHAMLGESGSIEEHGWRFALPEAGRALGTPTPLFKKLDASIVDEEEARLGL